MITDEDVKLIGQFTRKDIPREKLYTFDFILCDNEIDRDFEKFSDNALIDISKLFVGVTGIFDHNPLASNQNARIFKAEVIRDKERKNHLGEDYIYVKASAYMLITDKNRHLIDEIDAGIKKEVSIGCSTGKKVCSICGKQKCSHKKGKVYNGKRCFFILDDINDAYEWSFVAVPAQVSAGVLKNYSYKTIKNFLSNVSLGDDKKSFDEDKEKIEQLSYLAKLGSERVLELKAKVMKSFLLQKPFLDKETVKSITDKLCFEELLELSKMFDGGYMPMPQLFSQDNKMKSLNANEDFKI